MEASTAVSAFQYERNVCTSIIRGENKWIKEIYIPSAQVAFNLATDLFGKQILNIFESNGSEMQLSKRQFTPASDVTQEERDKIRQRLPEFFKDERNARNISKITLDPSLVKRIIEVKDHEDEAKRIKMDLKTELDTIF